APRRLVASLLAPPPPPTRGHILATHPPPHAPTLGTSPATLMLYPAFSTPAQPPTMSPPRSPPAPPMPDLPSSTTHQARYQALLADTCWSVMVPSSSGASPNTYPSTRRSVLLGPTLIRPPSASNPHPITPLPATAA